jgi:hypothetical protein
MSSESDATFRGDCLVASREVSVVKHILSTFETIYVHQCTALDRISGCLMACMTTAWGDRYMMGEQIDGRAGKFEYMPELVLA